ncbi:MAG: nickel pincer cofactor biosynthesis protein LarC [Acidobacteriia bacterium]|nr:nickel pincer cofactor biosynthesis protein LarC [Terriglobia bacterium]
MRQAYLDGSSGISGDMFLAAILDAGLDPRRLLEELKKLSLGFYEFKRTRVMRSGLVATRVDIRVPGHQPARGLPEIEALIEKAALPENAKAQARRVFARLAEVEGKLHNKPPEQIHFHEVGAVDAIIDIVGTCIGMELLEIGELVCSPLNVGGGRVEAAHGTLPVPAPATAELLKDIPIYSSGAEAELVTPTGAALVSTLAASFGPLPAMKVERIGYGAGEKEIHGHPNVARLFLGERIEMPRAQPSLPGDELVSVMEANVDDMSPQLYAYFAEQALAAGALDVTCSAIQMKKNRPGLLVSILCAPERADALAQLLFEQTTTIGVRIYEARRKILERESVKVETTFGAVNVKVARQNGRVLNVAPEYEDCQRLAAEKSVPLKEVMLAAQLAYRQRKEGT